MDASGPEGVIAGTLQLALNEAAKELILSTPSLSGPHAFVRSDSTLWRLGGGR